MAAPLAVKSIRRGLLPLMIAARVAQRQAKAKAAASKRR